MEGLQEGRAPAFYGKRRKGKGKTKLATKVVLSFQKDVRPPHVFLDLNKRISTSAREPPGSVHSEHTPLASPAVVLKFVFRERALLQKREGNDYRLVRI